MQKPYVLFAPAGIWTFFLAKNAQNPIYSVSKLPLSPSPANYRPATPSCDNFT